MASMRIPAPVATLVLALLACACTARPASPNDSASNAETCVYCHGTVGRVGNLPGTDPLLPSAPPSPPVGKPTAVTGAHQAHLNPPINGPLSAPVACSECHVVPQGLDHATNPPANPVQFGALAQAQGASPTYEPLRLGCAAVYCHGNFDFNGVKGSKATPLWTGGPVGCVSCHGMPPSGHPSLTGTVTAATCSTCHSDTVNADGSINLAGGGHLNGVADVVLDCTSCHGTAGRTGNQPGTDPLLASAPPVAPTGAPTSAVGAHLDHLNPPATGAFRGPIACNECHVVPSSGQHAVNPPAQKVVFGTLATTGGAAPVWTSTSTGCAATYCHGNFTFGAVKGSNATPLWTSTTPLTCASCHGLPPTNHPALTGAVTAATCSQCHPETVNADGTINVAGRKHINGQAEYVGGNHPAGWASPTQHGYSANQQGLQNCETCHTSFGPASGVATSSCNGCHTSAGHASWQNECTFCHGTPGRTGNVAGTDAFLAASPPVGPQGQTLTSDAMVGAHQKHVNPLPAGQKAPPFACTNCHASPLPSGVAHVNGLAVPIPFGGIAVTGNVRPTFNPTTLSCSATYCHGNFTGGATTAAPLWTGGAMSCSSCHGLPPGTGQHSRHSGQGVACGDCHSGYSTTAVNVTLHVNGVKNAGGAGTRINSWNGSTLQCAPACHGSERW